MTPYPWIKLLHLSTVTFTIAFFILRLGWMMWRPQLEYRPWVRPLSAGNDTVLLASGITMALLSHQYPLLLPWLTAKLIALLAYIMFGTLALRRGPTRPVRIASGLAALLCVFYIVAVALSRSPLPFLRG